MPKLQGALLFKEPFPFPWERSTVPTCLHHSATPFACTLHQIVGTSCGIVEGPKRATKDDKSGSLITANAHASQGQVGWEEPRRHPNCGSHTVWLCYIYSAVIRTGRQLPASRMVRMPLPESEHRNRAQYRPGFHHIVSTLLLDRCKTR